MFRETGDLPEDLVFYENYLGKRDATFTLNFSTGSAMVLAQYYNFARLGHEGYRYVMETMKYNARKLAKEITAIGEFELIGGEHDEQLPLVPFKLAGKHGYDEFDVAAQLAAERGWIPHPSSSCRTARPRSDSVMTRPPSMPTSADLSTFGAEPPPIAAEKTSWGIVKKRAYARASTPLSV